MPVPESETTLGGSCAEKGNKDTYKLKSSGVRRPGSGMQVTRKDNSVALAIVEGDLTSWELLWSLRPEPVVGGGQSLELPTCFSLLWTKYFKWHQVL